MKELRAREDFAKREMSRVSELVARGSATTQAFERASMDLQQVQGADLGADREDQRLHHQRADGRRGAAPRRRDRRNRRSRTNSVSRRRAQAAAGRGRGQRGGHSARRPRADRAVAHRRLSRPSARGQGARSHADGRRRRQDLSHQGGIARRHAAQAGHERGSQYHHPRETECLADPGRRAAKQCGFRGRRQPCAQTRGQDRHSRHPRRRGAVRSERRRACCIAGRHRAQGWRPRARDRRCGHEPHSRHCLDPCAGPRPADRLCRRRRRHRRRLLDHDGVADAGLAGRFHHAAGQYAGSYHRVRRTPHAAAATGRNALCRRGNSWPDAGGAPPRHQESAGDDGFAGSLGAGRRRPVGQDASDHPLRQPRHRHQCHRHRSAARSPDIRPAQADARRHAQRAVPRHQRHHHRRPAVGKDRRPRRRQYHPANQHRRRISAPRWSAFSTPACARSTRARLTF